MDAANRIATRMIEVDPSRPPDAWTATEIANIACDVDVVIGENDLTAVRAEFLAAREASEVSA